MCNTHIHKYRCVWHKYTHTSMCGSNLCDTHIHTYRDIHAQSRHIHTQTKTNTPVIRARAAAKARAFVLVAALFLDFAARQNKRHIHISTYPQTHTDTQINTQHTFDWSEGGCDSERACPCRRAVPWFRRARPKKKTYTLIHTHIYICPTHLLLERERLREQERLSLSPRRSLISPRVQKNKSYTHIHIYTYTQHTFCWSASGCESESACPCRRAVPWFRHPFLSPYPAPHQSTGPAASWPIFFFLGDDQRIDLGILFFLPIQLFINQLVPRPLDLIFSNDDKQRTNFGILYFGILFFLPIQLFISQLVQRPLHLFSFFDDNQRIDFGVLLILIIQLLISQLVLRPVQFNLIFIFKSYWDPDPTSSPPPFFFCDIQRINFWVIRVLFREFSLSADPVRDQSTGHTVSSFFFFWSRARNGITTVCSETNDTWWQRPIGCLK